MRQRNAVAVSISLMLAASVLAQPSEEPKANRAQKAARAFPLHIKI